MKRQRKRTHVFQAMLLSIVLVVGLVVPASATGDDAKNYVTAVWDTGVEPDDWDGGTGQHAPWPQTLVGYVYTSSPNLHAADHLVTDCGVFQIDVYHYKAKKAGNSVKDQTKAILNAGTLNWGGDHNVILSGGQGTAWKMVVDDNCEPPPSPPIPGASAESSCDYLHVTMSVGGDESGNSFRILDKDGNVIWGGQGDAGWIEHGDSKTVDIDPSKAPVEVNYWSAGQNGWRDGPLNDDPWPKTFDYAQPDDCVKTTKLKISKVVDGEGNKPHWSTKFEFTYDCGEGATGTKAIRAGQHSGWIPVDYTGDLPTCTVTETKTRGADHVSNNKDDGGAVAVFGLSENRNHNKVEFTNTYDPPVFRAKFKVWKQVDGNGVAPEGDFDFEWQCGDQSGDFSLGDGDHSGWIWVNYTGSNTSCSVTETGTQGADHVKNNAGGSTVADFTINKVKPKQVTFTNTFDLPAEVSTDNTCIGVDVTVHANDTRRTWRILDGDGEVIEEFWLDFDESKTVSVAHDEVPFSVEWKHGSDFVPFTANEYDNTWTQPDDCLEIDASSICVAGLTTGKWGIITGGEMIFEVHGSGGYDGQEIPFNYRPAGSPAIQSGSVESGGSTLASSEVGILGMVFVRIDGGTIHDRITLKSYTDCTPSVTLEKEWDNLTDEQLDELGVSVLFEDQDENLHEPGETISLEPGEMIELTEQVDGLPQSCTWSSEGDLSWTAPGLDDLEAYVAAHQGEGLHEVLTAVNTVNCEVDISTEVLTDGFCVGFDAEIEITNNSDVEVELEGVIEINGDEVPVELAAEVQEDEGDSDIVATLAPGETILLTIPTSEAGIYTVFWTATDTLTRTAEASGEFSFEVVECTPSISLVKSADETEFTFAEGEDTSYEVTYTYVITNDGDLPLDALTLIDDITTLGTQVDLTAELTAALDDAFGTTVLDVGDSVEVEMTATYDAATDPAQIDNTATVTGFDPFETEVSDSDDESISAIIVLAEVEEEPEVEPEEEPAVERVAVTRPVEETRVLGTTLARTGGSILALLIGGLLALFAGGGVLRRRRDES